MQNIETNINFQALFESAPGLFLVLKPDAPHFTIVGVSDAYLKATMTERKKIVGQRLFEVFPDNPDDKTADGTSNLKKSLETVIRKKAAHTMALQKYDIQRPASEGGGFEERYWSPHNSPVLNDKQELQYIIHRVEDVTEFSLFKKHSIEEIENARDKLVEKTILINSNQERINVILEALLKYTVMDFSKKIPVSEHADELDAIAVGLNTLSEELVSSREAEELQIQNIKKVNKFLDTILENIPNMVFVKDVKELRFLRFNKAGEKLLGYSRADLMGKNDYDFFPKEQADFFTSKDRDAINKNGVTDIPEELIKTANGDKWLHTKKIPILDEEGKPLFLLGISEDITERKLSEEKVKKLNDELLSNVEQLKSVNKELESFSYSVSHDLRAPLRAIDGYAGILDEDYGKVLDEEGKRILETVKYNAKKMGNLIDDLLAFSRLGKKELTKTKINMNELVEGALYELNKSVKHNATVKIKYLHSSKGDYGLINQVIVNLLSNAIKYSSKVKEPRIVVSSEDKEQEIIYSVEDNGAGFDMKYANKLFGVFQRLHTMDEFEGTGVGLAIVQRIINKHGGKVWAEGEKNKGATFRFSLPTY